MKLIADAWREFEIEVIPLNAPEVQRTECRRAFYQGALSLFYRLTGILDADREPTAADLKKMDDIKAEIDQFVKDLKEGRV